MVTGEVGLPPDSSSKHPQRSSQQMIKNRSLEDPRLKARPPEPIIPAQQPVVPVAKPPKDKSTEKVYFQ